MNRSLKKTNLPHSSQPPSQPPLPPTLPPTPSSPSSDGSLLLRRPCLRWWARSCSTGFIGNRTAEAGSKMGFGWRFGYSGRHFFESMPTMLARGLGGVARMAEVIAPSSPVDVESCATLVSSIKRREFMKMLIFQENQQLFSFFSGSRRNFFFVLFLPCSYHQRPCGKNKLASQFENGAEKKPRQSKICHLFSYIQ